MNSGVWSSAGIDLEVITKESAYPAKRPAECLIEIVTTHLLPLTLLSQSEMGGKLNVKHELYKPHALMAARYASLL